MRGRLLTACAFAVAMAQAHAAVAAAPEVGSLLPAGGQRGTTVTVVAGGKFDPWPVHTWVDRPGLTISPGGDKGQLSVAIAPDAAAGLYGIRLYNDEGASAPQSFVVGTLAEVLEAEPNNAPHQAQAVSSSNMVANGRLEKRGDVDLFAVPLQQGQTLVASLTAHETLGSPVDAVLHVISPTGQQLAYNHDLRGLDPEITFTAPTDGNYLVRVFGFPSTPNQTIGLAGGDSYVYRLTLTTGPFVDYAWPLALTRQRETRVEIFGWNVSDSLRTLAINAEGDMFEVSRPELGNVASLSVEPHETLVETEPNENAAPQSIAPPVTVTGRIGQPGDVDVYAFQATSGQPLEFDLASRALGYPLDGVLQVFDGQGKSLARVDDAGSLRDPLLSFSPPADGAYRVVVSDLNRQGSQRHVYRLRAVPALPTYEIATDAHSYTLMPGKATEITLLIDRKQGFAEEIQCKAIGLPDFVTAAPAVSAATGDSAKSVKLSLTSTGGAFSGPIRIQAEATGASRMTRTATAAIPDHTARISDLWLTVAAPKP